MFLRIGTGGRELSLFIKSILNINNLINQLNLKFYCRGKYAEKDRFFA
jgi:hypothetical protein